LRPRLELPLDKLASLLAEADLIKFAARRVRRERASQYSAEARHTVAEIERVERARLEAAKESQAARAA
jgi:CHASE3 domain sensor protein